ncbi:MAG: hypothetical protein OXI60_01795, partial [Acidiferrobacterales bacterium]|nr:hypothetical protein [Acidiferrobacterales bacterium]
MRLEVVKFVDITVRELLSSGATGRCPEIAEIMMNHGHEFVVDSKNMAGVTSDDKLYKSSDEYFTKV